MRNFKCSPHGEIVDLDDKETYTYLPSNPKQLDDMMFAEIGKAICYMDYFHPEYYKEDSEQRKRVNIQINHFCSNRKYNYDNTMWYKEQIFLFQDETENMC